MVNIHEPEVPITDAIAAVRSDLTWAENYRNFPGGWQNHINALRAALAYLEAHERVVAERDQAQEAIQIQNGVVLSGTKKLIEARVERDAARKELADLQRTFDLRWKADQRAIKQWQEAHPGNDLVWPDHCDMVVWLLDQLDAARATLDDEEASGQDSVDLIGRLRAELAEARAEIERLRAPSSGVARNGYTDADLAYAGRLLIPNPDGIPRVEAIALAIAHAREAEREKYRAVVNITRRSPPMSHTGHWVSNEPACPECKIQRDWREDLLTALAALEDGGQQ